MDVDRKERLIDKLLILMNDYIEKEGLIIETMLFQFCHGQQERQYILQEAKLVDNELDILLNTCITREYIKYYSCGCDDFESLQLTKSGQDRAITAKLKRNPSCEFNNTPQIASVIINGPAQVGNRNVQNFENFIIHLKNSIDNANAPNEQKIEAKNLLEKFLEHPLTCSIIGGTIGGITSSLK